MQSRPMIAVFWLSWFRVCLNKHSIDKNFSSIKEQTFKAIHFLKVIKPDTRRDAGQSHFPIFLITWNMDEFKQKVPSYWYQVIVPRKSSLLLMSISHDSWHDSRISVFQSMTKSVLLQSFCLKFIISQKNLKCFHMANFFFC